MQYGKIMKLSFLSKFNVHTFPTLHVVFTREMFFSKLENFSVLSRIQPLIKIGQFGHQLI
jgi:hypothetical protein